MEIAVAGAAAEDGAPDPVFAHLFEQLINRIRHAQTLTSCLIAIALPRSTMRLPSSLSHMRSQGKGLGAGPSIFTPSLLELAAVAGAGNDAEVRLVSRQAAEVGTDGREREETFRRAHHVDGRLRVEGDRIRRDSGPAFRHPPPATAHTARSATGTDIRRLPCPAPRPRPSQRPP